MTEITDGVRVTGSITPTDTTDTYPTHSAEYGKGGHRTVADVTARDAIPTDRREEGMTVFVQDNGVTYRLSGGITNSDWTTGMGAGVATNAIVQGGRITAGIGPFSESSGASALKFIGAESNQISLYDQSSSDWLTYAIPDGGVVSADFGTGDDPSDPSDPSQPALVADKNYDVYVYAADPSSGELALWFEEWSTDILRNVSPVRLDGVRVHGNDPEFRFVGTIRTFDDMGTIKTKDDDQQRFVWNENNRVERRSVVRTSGTWSESSATWVAVDGGSADWLFEWVSGGEVAQDTIEYIAQVEHRRQSFSSDPVEYGNSEIGVGFDSTTALDSQAIVGVGGNLQPSTTGNDPFGTQIHSRLVRVNTPGYHYTNAIARKCGSWHGQFRADRNQGGFTAKVMA